MCVDYVHDLLTMFIISEESDNYGMNDVFESIERFKTSWHGDVSYGQNISRHYKW